MDGWHALEVQLGVHAGRREEAPAAKELQNAWGRIASAVLSDIRIVASELLPHLIFLRRHRYVIYISPAEARLLLTLLEKVETGFNNFGESRGPKGEDSRDETGDVAAVEECCFLLLAVWFRRAAARGQVQGGGNEQRGFIEAAAVKLIVAKLDAGTGRLYASFLGAGILCLGSICAAQACAEEDRTKAREAIIQVLLGGGWGAGTEGVREALAGSGYAMSASRGSHLWSLFSSLLCMWVPRGSNMSPLNAAEDIPSLEQGVLLLQLMAYEGLRLRTWGGSSWPADSSLALSDLQGLVRICRRGVMRESFRESERQVAYGLDSTQCAAIMSTAGLLRGLCEGRGRQGKRPHIASLPDPLWSQEVQSLQDVVAIAANDANPWEDTFGSPLLRTLTAPKLKPVLAEQIEALYEFPPEMAASLIWAPAADFCKQSSRANRTRRARHWLRYVAIAVARLYGAGGPGTPPHPAVLRCLEAALWGDAVQWGPFYTALVTSLHRQHGLAANSELKEVQYGVFRGVDEELNKSARMHALEWLRKHIALVPFNEAGAITRALCEQVQGADMEMRLRALQLACLYAKGTHQGHRFVYVEASRGRPGPIVLDNVTGVDPKAGQESGANIPLTPTIATALNASFLSVCMFFAALVPDDVSPLNFDLGRGGMAPAKELRGEEHRQYAGSENEQAHKLRCAVHALEALAFMDFTAVPMAEYGKLVQRAANKVAINSGAVEAFVSLMPRYDEVISGPGWESDTWQYDAVQTSCMYFWLRVLPLCLPHLDSSLFANRVASTLFLYLHHPQQDVNLAAHALFSTFLKETEQKMKVSRSDHLGVEALQPVRERWLVIEQMAVHYAEEALKAYPTATPLKGLVSGVVAMCLYLPPDSSACALCLRAIGERSYQLLTRRRQEPSIEEEESCAEERGKLRDVAAHRRVGEAAGEGVSKQVDLKMQQTEAGSKLRSMLAAVIPLVSLQMLPISLQVVARLLLRLSAEGESQARALAEVYEVLASSDDYTRKPFTVPFFQSLSYLCTVQLAQGSLPSDGGRVPSERQEQKERRRSSRIGESSNQGKLSEAVRPAAISRQGHSLHRAGSEAEQSDVGGSASFKYRVADGGGTCDSEETPSGKVPETDGTPHTPWGVRAGSHAGEEGTRGSTSKATIVEGNSCSMTTSRDVFKSDPQPLVCSSEFHSADPWQESVDRKDSDLSRSVELNDGRGQPHGHSRL